MSTINMMFILIFMLNVYIGAMQPGIDGSGNSGGNSTSVSVLSSTSALSSDSAFLTIQGTNFAETESDNEVTLTPSNGDAVRATVYNSTENFIVLQFHHLSPLNEGVLSASVSTSPTTNSGSAVQVAKILAAKPIVKYSASDLSSDSSTLIISGTGFVAGQAAFQGQAPDPNIVTFSSTPATYDTITGDCTNSTMTSLTIQFTHLLPSAYVYSLSASVTVLATWSSTSVTVATVIPGNGPQGDITTTTEGVITTEAMSTGGGGGNLWEDTTTTETVTTTSEAAVTTTTQATPQLSCEEMYTVNTSLCDVDCGSSDPYSVSPVYVRHRISLTKHTH